MTDSAVADLSHIPVSAGLATTLARASEGARASGATEVSLEHVLTALCDDVEAVDVMAACNIDAARLKSEVITYLVQQQQPGAAPYSGLVTVSPALMRILEAAAAAARGGRRRDINGAIVLAAIVGDGRSVAASILQGHGLTFDSAIRALQTSMGQPKSASPDVPPPAEDVLARARERVQSRSAPSLREIMLERPSAVPLPPKEPVFHDVVPVPRQPEWQPAYPPAAPVAEPEPSPDQEAAASEPELDAPEIAEPEFEASDEPYLSELEQGAGAPAPQPPPAAPLPASAAPAPSLPAGPLPADGALRETQAPNTGLGGASLPPAAPVAHPAPMYPPPAPPPAYPPQGAPPGGFAPAPPSDARGWAGPPPSPANYYPPAGGQPPAAQPSMPGPPMGFERPRTGPQPPPIPPPIPRAGAALAPGAAVTGQAPGYGVPPSVRAPQGPLTQPVPQMRQQGPAATPAVKREAKSAAEMGQLSENIPRTMRSGVTERVEIRIGRSHVEGITVGMDGAGVAWRHDVTVTKAMSVRVRAPEGGFFIETASPETQWIDKQFADAGDDFASWRFLITPQRRGWSELQIMVSARSIGSDGLAAETAFPDQVIEVKVRTNYGRAFLKASGWLAAGIAGGALAKFGEAAFGAGSGLLSRFLG